MASFPSTSIEVIRRVNRPSTTSKASLELIILNNGAVLDPYQVCSVHIFPVILGSGTSTPVHYFQETTASSSEFGIVATSGANVSADFIFSGTSPFVSALPDSSAYDGTTSAASGIYKVDTGHFAVALDPDSSCIISGTVAANGASAVADYFDVWTVVNTSSSSAQLYINEFRMYDDTFVGLTEKLLLRAKNKLKTTRFQNGEIAYLIFNTRLNVLNENISDNIKSIIQKSIIDNAQLRILKYHEDSNLPNFVEVSGFSDTSSSVIVDSEDSISFLFDTTQVSSVTNVGATPGLYHAQVKYTVFDQTFYSEEFPFLIE